MDQIEKTQLHNFEVLDSVGARLIVLEGAKAGAVFALQGASMTIGRHPDSDIFLSDITVSRHHAEVTPAEGGHEVRDSGSLNGTYVNQQRVENAKLTEGDILQVGRFKLQYLGTTGQTGTGQPGTLGS